MMVGTAVLAPAERQLAFVGKGCITVLSRSTFFPCPVLKKAKVEKAVPAGILSVKSNSDASADVMSSTWYITGTEARTVVRVRIPVPREVASDGETKRRVLLPVSSVSKKKTLVASH